MANDEGILHAEGDWNEQGVLKAIFARYIDILIEEKGQYQYLPWLRKNINTVWKNRDRERNLMFRDYDMPAPTGKINRMKPAAG